MATRALVTIVANKGGDSGEYNVKAYGATGDGVTDDTATIQAALTACNLAGGGVVFLPAGDFYFTGLLTVGADTILCGIGYESRLHPVNAGGSTMTVGSNVVIKDLRLDGSAPGGISMRSGVSNIKFINCYFRGISQVIWLWECTNVEVSSCIFDGTGYGIIQQAGYTSDNVIVQDNIAFDMLGDFLNANCESSNPSKDWIITNNRYLGNAQYPTPGTEERFICITSVKGVIISNNFVMNSAGDSAFHLESTLGYLLIEGNYVENCAGAYAYIYLLSSSKDTIINDNYFVQSDTSLPTAMVMNLASGSYSNPITFSNNKIIGNADYDLSGIYVGSQSQMIITGNYFYQCDIAIQTNIGANILVANNSVRDCNYGIKSENTAAGGSNNDWTVTGNHFVCNTKSIEIRRNTGGTNPSRRWLINSNYFSNDAMGYDTVDFTAIGNTIANGKTLNFGASQYSSSERYNSALNVEQGTGMLGSKVNALEVDGALNHDGTTVGLYGTTPVVQGAALTAQLTTVTCTAPGTPDYAIADPVQNTGFGFSTSDEMLSLLKVVANLQARCAELEARLGSSTGIGAFV